MLPASEGRSARLWRKAVVLMVHELGAKVGSGFFTLLREITTVPLCLHRMVPAFGHLRRNWFHRHLLLN
jgi:hypothetical protein